MTCLQAAPLLPCLPCRPAPAGDTGLQLRLQLHPAGEGCWLQHSAVYVAGGRNNMLHMSDTVPLFCCRSPCPCRGSPAHSHSSQSQHPTSTETSPVLLHFAQVVFFSSMLPGPAAERALGYLALILLSWSPLLWSAGPLLLRGPNGAGSSSSGSGGVSSGSESEADEAAAGVQRRSALASSPAAAVVRLRAFARKVATPPFLAVLAGAAAGMTPLGEARVGVAVGTGCGKGLQWRYRRCHLHYWQGVAAVMAWCVHGVSARGPSASLCVFSVVLLAQGACLWRPAAQLLPRCWDRWVQVSRLRTQQAAVHACYAAV